MPSPLKSLEETRFVLLGLIIAWAVCVAGMINLEVNVWLIYAVLLGGVLLLGAVLLSFMGNLAKLLQANTECAQQITSGNFQANFPQSKPGSRLIGESQIALQAMLGYLKKELSLVKGVMDGMVTPYAVTDTNEIFIRGNDGLIRMLEQEGKCEDHYGENVAIFFYGEKRPTVLGIAMRDRQPISKEVEFTGRKGGKRNIFIDASPLYDLGGNLMGALCIYTDLSEIRASEAKLCAQNEVVSTAASKATNISTAMAKAAEDLADQVSVASQGTEDQKARMAETATAMEEMNVTVFEVAKNASQAAEASDQARMKAINGVTVVEESVSSINKVQRQSTQMRTNLGELGKHAEQIGQIMNVIEDIADQTNLLALNAAIEAARAGEAGRGFAVVADEVRKLAEKTMTATKEVGQAITTIQEGTRKNIASMNSAVDSIAEATTKANLSRQVLQEILSLAELAADQVRSIATAAEEQSATSEEINRAAEQINQISVETSQVMDHAKSAVEDLARMAVDLDAIIAEMRAQAPKGDQA